MQREENEKGIRWAAGSRRRRTEGHSRHRADRETLTARAGMQHRTPALKRPQAAAIVRLRLQGVQVIDRPLRMGGGLEDVPRVVLKTAQPVIDIRRMFRARCGRQAEIGSQEGRAKLGHKLLLRIAGIAPPLPTETPVETLTFIEFFLL